ncbi:unnamed protein product [Kluyveromyces dobzhanskii CBS 2104]|uniref:Phosphodiesterase n=1 Tax=Kluyveromyces dobzhanskii CBS 2104 TaxID=1427455 RepID=A0A0A8L5V5_9SACH|nr:unnamed protein product [Kluyveromyces dobzhanskii CBS 2104]
MTVNVCCVGPCVDVVKRLSKDADRVSLQRFVSVSQLIKWFFEKRLQDKHTTFEGSCLFICYDPIKAKLRSTSPLNSIDPETLSFFISDMFPCFNVMCVPCVDFIDYYESSILDKNTIGNDDTDVNLDRISNVYRWMYSDTPALHEDSKDINAKSCAASQNGCSTNLYTMASHLAYLTCNDRLKRESVPIWEYIDVSDWIQSNLSHDNDYYWKCLNSWEFCAHSLDCTELIWCSYLLFDKLSSEAELSHPPPSTNRLLLMLLNIEAAYHQENKFHNFRHAVDVLQATYQLCHLLEVPNIASFLLCISAIGHDVGHPGTNNMLFNKYHSPISKYYKEQSVLENFHADIYLDIFSRYWPDLSQEFATIKDSIIATDMALHNHYVETIKQDSAPSLTGLTSLIIKAADISNVTRPLLISAKWAALISMEFKECALLEKNLVDLTDKSGNDHGRIIHKLHADEVSDYDEDLPSNIDDILEKYPNIPKGQAFFIDTFALSLFSGLGLKFKQLQFLVHNVENNRKYWSTREGNS